MTPAKANPYFITGPALISFSGGRTSGYMLKQIIDAHGGILPNDVYVVFANTGKEREETLRFVHECGTRWGIYIHWVEWAESPKRRKAGELKLDPISDAQRRFSFVGYNSASRNGEPFAKLIERKRFLPTTTMRYCTSTLKVETLKWFMIAQGHETWLNVIGLRGDEMHRVFRQIERNEQAKERWQSVMPMAKNGSGANGRMVREQDVLDFWKQQPFDLGLKSYEGNCDLCFLKSRGKLLKLIRDNPTSAEWWSEQEKIRSQRNRGNVSKSSGQFRRDESYNQIAAAAVNSIELPMFDDAEEYDAECGLWCAGEES
jgi:3'-phosphoadenosine 5'-phosphosulfate sulfotransferase (PAPS reductase)/FAD synthetase